ncbi:MAG: hypothetical protein M1820_005157 [Bogoriella megaspora]|nr:MAG: hypothetical protein M1820_005157 [Bogoriella megaspora]
MKLICSRTSPTPFATADSFYVVSGTAQGTECVIFSTIAAETDTKPAQTVTLTSPSTYTTAIPATTETLAEVTTITTYATAPYDVGIDLNGVGAPTLHIPVAELIISTATTIPVSGSFGGGGVSSSPGGSKNGGTTMGGLPGGASKGGSVEDTSILKPGSTPITGQPGPTPTPGQITESEPIHTISSVGIASQHLPSGTTLEPGTLPASPASQPNRNLAPTLGVAEGKGPGKSGKPSDNGASEELRLGEVGGSEASGRPGTGGGSGGSSESGSNGAGDNSASEIIANLGEGSDFEGKGAVSTMPVLGAGQQLSPAPGLDTAAGPSARTRAPIMIGSVSATPIEDGVFVLPGAQTLVAGGRPVTAAGTTYFPSPSGGLTIDGKQASSLSLSGDTHDETITFGSVLATRVGSNEVLLAGQTLNEGGPPVTVLGITYSLSPSGAAIVNGDTVSALSPITASASSAVIVIALGGDTLLVHLEAEPVLAISGRTLYPGSAPVTVTASGHVETISAPPNAVLANGGELIVVNGVTQTLAPGQTTLSEPDGVILTFTSITASKVILGGKTLAPSGAAITTNGATISELPNGDIVEASGGVTSTIGNAGISSYTVSGIRSGATGASSARAPEAFLGDAGRLDFRWSLRLQAMVAGVFGMMLLELCNGVERAYNRNF